jgi:hypothetical protein
MKKLLCVLLAAIILFTLQPTAYAAMPVSKNKYYARSTLSGGELSYYDALYAAMPRRTAVESDKFGVTRERSYQLLQYIYNDAPEILGYYIVLSMPQEDAINKQIGQQTKTAMAKLNANMDEAQKALALYKYMAQTIAPDVQNETTNAGSHVSQETADSGTIVGGLITCKATSRGIARTYQYLLYQTGIPCYTVTGTALGLAHSWDMLQIGGDWYFADPALDMDAVKKGGQLAYFLLDHSIFKDHTVNQNENPPLPAARSTKYMAKASASASQSVSPSPSPEEQAPIAITPDASQFSASAPAAAPIPIRAEQSDAKADNAFTTALVVIMIALVALVIFLSVRKRKA